MYYVYILKSKKDEQFYTGFTAREEFLKTSDGKKEINRRLKKYRNTSL